MLYWTIIDGTLSSIITEWKWKLFEDNTFKIISNKKTLCTYNIIEKTNIKVPIRTNEGIMWIETKRIKLIKKAPNKS